MAQRIKHNKIKNTGILFELLTRQVTADVMNNIENSKAIEFLKKYFNENTALGKENKLYQILIKENYNSENKANYLIDTILREREKIQNSKLRSEKYNLIKDLKEFYNIDEFFRGKIPNYRTIASIYKLFQSETSATTFNPDEVVQSRYSIVEHIVNTKIKSKIEKNENTKEYTKQEKDLRLLTYQILVDKFNAKYKDLSEAQKTLLREYINNVSNTNSLREFINSEVDKIKKILNKFLPRVDDKVTKIKLTETIRYADNIKKGSIVKDRQVISLMRYYELIKELKNVGK